MGQLAERPGGDIKPTLGLTAPLEESGIDQGLQIAMAFNLAGGEWLVYYGLGFAVELGILALILRAAWTWPRTGSTSTAGAAAQVQALTR